MNLSKLILKIFGWKVIYTNPHFDKSIICVAPHTSNWDFIIGELAIHAENIKSGFLMKEAWFFFPLGLFFKSIGGVPVPKKRSNNISTVDHVINKFNSEKRLNVAVTPEGTRSLNSDWKTGFLRIAYGANIPIQLAYIDFKTKTVGLEKVYCPIGDLKEDINYIKNYYKNYTGKYPEKFSI